MYDQLRFLLSLERDFIRTMDFVELSPDNYNCFSIEFAKIILLCASEFETTLESLVGSSFSGRVYAEDLIREMNVQFPGFHQAEAFVPRHSLTRVPFAEWKDPKGLPPFWFAYNKIKHERLANFQLASQINALDALCAAGLMLAYKHHSDEISDRFDLISIGLASQTVLRGPKRKLPGMP